MIPILFPSDATTFTTNGIGRLTDIVSCLCFEERNGLFEVEFEYPITGVHYSDIKEGRIIIVTHDDTKTKQPFRIYRRSAPMSGIVTFNARHICYGLQNVIVAPFTGVSCADTLSKFSSEALTDCPYTFWTDKTAVGTFKLTRPASVWELLGGTQGSVLDVYGTGEWQFNNWEAKLYLHRGTNSGVTIRYGKNMTDIEHTIEDDGTYNAIVPYWTDGTVTVVGNVIHSPNATPEYVGWTTDHGVQITADADDGEWIEFAILQLKAIPYDFSSYFDEEPSVADLNSQALTFLNANTPWIPHENITVDFVAMWQTEDYKDFAAIQRVKLCDTVTILYPGLGVNATAQVIRTVYNVLLDRYDEIEVGDAQTTYGDLIKQESVAEVTSLIESNEGDIQDLIDAAIAHSQSVIEGEIEYATDLITGGLGGHVVIKTDANGKPQEILIMDTESELTAVNVLRINVNGIGFSSNGVSGPFSSAWTLDGHFVADFIATGNLNASLITTGVLNATLIKTGILDGLYFTCQNLTATNCNITGIFKALIDASNYLKMDSGSLELYANGNKTLAISHLYDDGSVVGGQMLLYDSNATERIQMRANHVNNQTSLYLRASDGKLGVALQDNGYWLYNADGKEVIRNVTTAAGKGQIRIKDPDNTYPATYIWDGRIDISYTSTVHSVLQDNGIWFYDPAYSGRQDGIVAMITTANGIYTNGDLVVGGSKLRAIDTEHYGTRGLNAYETPEPYFGDIGESQIGQDGRCEVMIEEIFGETIDHDGYQVFLQKYGRGDCWVSDRLTDRFIVEGDAGLKFGWEIKAHQIDHNGKRLEKVEVKAPDANTEHTY